VRHAGGGGSRPKVVVVHNHYQQAGGEDQVFRAEVELLRAHAHDVVPYTIDNHSVADVGTVRLVKATFWNSSVYHQLRALFRAHGPDVVHFHNTFPLISPAAYYAARAEGVPVVQTLHNFRLLCPNALFFRQGRICEDCLGKAVPWPGVLHACYRDDRRATSVAAGMLSVHRAIGTWADRVSVYVTLSDFARGKFIAGGLPANRIVVKPNFLAPDPGVGDHAGNFALFVGRLSEEKGLGVLLDAWRQLRAPVALKIVGSGPLETAASSSRPEIEWLGRQPRERVLALMKDAAFLVLPSECYENFPSTLVEAFATGLPVIASAQGSLAELVHDRWTGRQFRTADPSDLAATVEWMVAHPEDRMAMGQRARDTFESRYGAEENYKRLMDIYRLAAERVRSATE